MLQALKDTANVAYTENGALTHATSGSDCLDLFATIGALRSADETEIEQRFMRAWAENPDLAIKILFYARDVRGGLGERRAFKTILHWLGNEAPATVLKNLPLIAEYGRYDDVLCLFDTQCEFAMLLYIKEQLMQDCRALRTNKPVSLLAKWLPSINTSSDETRRMAHKIMYALGWKAVQYRKTLVALRDAIKIIENNLRTRDYTFDYSKQPSKAMYKYREAFLRNDEKRYMAFMERVNKGEAKLHTDTLYPYDIIAPIVTYWNMPVLTPEKRLAMDATWKAQPDFIQDENALVVVDGSGSMYCEGNPMPAAVAEALAIYFAERNKGAFKDYFITFSEHPQLVQIKGKDIVEKVQYCMNYNECANTNIQRVFELILQAALKHKVPQEEIPSKLYIISDMEFDGCAKGANLTNFEYAKQLFADHGYALPQVIFWNVQSRHTQQPVRQNEQGVALVSGASPRIFNMLTSGTLDPYSFMLDVLGSERYSSIAA